MPTNAPTPRLDRETLRLLRDAVHDIFPDPEECEECAARDESSKALGIDGSPCRLCGSMPLWKAYQAANEALGPCICGHPCSRHHDEDAVNCRDCDCRQFKLPTALPAPAPVETPGLIGRLRDEAADYRRSANMPDRKMQDIQPMWRLLADLLDEAAAALQSGPTLARVTRLEVIGDAGRMSTILGIKSLSFSLQDDGRTLKVFASHIENAAPASRPVEAK